MTNASRALHTVLAFGTMFGGLALAEAAVAAEFPTKTITVVAGSGPGGAIDILARIAARGFERDFKQPVVVVNRGGAGGGIAAAQLKNETPDGHMVAVAVSSTWARAWQEMDNPTFTADDFTYINSMTGGGCSWVVKADGPYKTWKDVVAAAKSGKSVSFGAFSNDNKLTLRHVAKQEGVDFRMITMKSVPEVLQAVLGGHVDFGFSGGSHVTHVKKGTMRVLTSTDANRLPDSPDAPTLRELGYGVSECAVFMMAGPKGIPADVTQKLADSIKRSMDTEEAQKFLESREATVVTLGPQALDQRIKTEAKEHAVLLKSAKD